MQELLIITPVKDSIDHTIRTMEAVVQSELTVPHRYVVFNDNSTPENTARLHAEGQRLGVEVVDFGRSHRPPLAQLPLCAAPLSKGSLGRRRGTADCGERRDGATRHAAKLYEARRRARIVASPPR